MRVLKWLFHPVYLLIIIVIFALYVNRDALFSEEVAESLEVEALVSKVDELAERLRSDAEAEPTTALPEIAETEVADKSVNEASDAVAEVASSPVPEATESVTDESASVAESVAEESAPVAEVVSAVSNAESTSLQSESQLEPLAVVTEIESSTVPGEVAVASPLSVWQSARAAVWQGDLSGAVAQYRQLVAQQPDNYDAYGEMGNVLLAQSDVAAAVDAYVKAARLIHQSGNQRMARHLVGVVASLDEAQGQLLYNEFFQ